MTALMELPVTAPDAPELSPAERNRRRRRLRRRFLLAGLVPLAVALAFSAKVATMAWADHTGRDAYGEGNFAEAQDQFAANGTLNLFEPWISPYDDGTALYQLGDFTGAEDALEEALGLAPAGQVCRVRINLALTDEAIGDSLAETRPFAALRAYKTGAGYLAGDGCLEGSTAQGIDARLQEKLSRRGPTIAPGPGSDDAARQLGLLNERAERLSRRAEQRQRDQRDDEAAPFSDAQGGVPVYTW
jgi:tetratricopeptide (TPR) repeat protein